MTRRALSFMLRQLGSRHPAKFPVRRLQVNAGSVLQGTPVA
jgi:hypothetical protein